MTGEKEKAVEDKVTEPSVFMSHMKSAGKSVVRQWGSLIPKEFWQHGREARREFLLALRVVVDGAIERIDPEGEPAPVKKKPAPRRRKSKIEVEVEAPEDEES